MDAATALKMLALKADYAFLIDALKNFKIMQSGSDVALVWFGRLVNIIKSASWKFGTAMKDGTALAWEIGDARPAPA